ncbi:MAG: DinB family protein [Flavobacteriales bacterium]
MPHHFLPDDLTHIFTRDLATLAEEVRSTPDEKLWMAAPGVVNSVGTLAIHMCGNLQHFIGAVLGNSGYVRNREAEFSHTPRSKEDIIAEIEATSIAVQTALAQLSEADLSREMPDTPPHHKGRSVGYFLVQLVAHFARHSGQLNYLRRMISSEGV